MKKREQFIYATKNIGGIGFQPHALEKIIYSYLKIANPDRQIVVPEFLVFTKEENKFYFDQTDIEILADSDKYNANKESGIYFENFFKAEATIISENLKDNPVDIYSSYTKKERRTIINAVYFFSIVAETRKLLYLANQDLDMSKNKSK